MRKKLKLFILLFIFEPYKPVSEKYDADLLWLIPFP